MSSDPATPSRMQVWNLKQEEAQAMSGTIMIDRPAFAMPGDRERFLEFGMTDYIAKPVDARTLLSTVWKTLATRNSTSSPAA